MRYLIGIWFLVMAFVRNGYAQLDTLVMGSGYQNDVFYKLSDGAKTVVSRDSWDLAFSMALMSATIRINDGKGIELYKTPYGPTDWNTPITDTANIVTSNNQLFNSTIDWYEGAFNANRDTNNSLDQGWGMYNISTHVVTGTTIYVLKFPNNTYKKIFIDLLDPNTGKNYYVFRYANLDNANEIVDTIFRDSYSNKEFVYYDLENGMVKDLQPASAGWDLLLTRYVEDVSGTPYPVVGFLQHPKVTVVELYPVDTAIAQYPTPPYSDTINTIGYDWKEFDMGTFQYVVRDSLVYFVQDQENKIWKLVFLSFSGSGTGTVVFQKTYMGSSAHIEAQLGIEDFQIYPNPVSSPLKVKGKFVTPTSYSLALYSLEGRRMIFVEGEGEQINHLMDVQNFPNGYYFLELATSTGKLIRSVVIQH